MAVERLRDAQISIHAPARGATKYGLFFDSLIQFQSTPPRGERLFLVLASFLLSYFNPRPREGSDTRPVLIEIKANISIHAPARGATIYLHTPRMRPEFQSTPPRGERPKSGKTQTAVGTISIHAPARGATSLRFAPIEQRIFQSTPPRGERPAFRELLAVHWNFNPRPREGSDHHFMPRLVGKAISIHAPARGATA